MDDGMNAAPRERAPYDGEAALRAALNVDASPEFLARVRRRIASEPQPARWRLAWGMVSATAVVVLIAAAVLIRTDIEPPRPIAVDVAITPAQPTPAPAPVETVPNPVAVVAPAPPVERQPVTASAPSVRRMMRRVAAVRPAPAIVIDRAEVAAFERLVARIGTGSLPAGPAVVTPPEMTAEIQFVPVEIAPIVFASAGEGGDVQ